MLMRSATCLSSIQVELNVVALGRYQNVRGMVFSLSVENIFHSLCRIVRAGRGDERSSVDRSHNSA
ncbi:hypothetical protein BN2476_110202 [Paraburkholderia piptadeniae]|uniref:Uncharacterized protein n=1 Tax=Paraburkholderia piptadeniae TaxID=1701573 RepID=A0A1N7RQ75_9BURK|nr:hypothetical protein BN2476_110202 [Paraburkholderia piptadeniae]